MGTATIVQIIVWYSICVMRVVPELMSVMSSITLLTVPMDGLKSLIPKRTTGLRERDGLSCPWFIGTIICSLI